MYFFKADPDMIIRKSEIVTGVIVRTKKWTRREGGFDIRFDDNAVVLLNKDGSPKGTFRFYFYSFEKVGLF